jgi:hypothetical protein
MVGMLIFGPIKRESMGEIQLFWLGDGSMEQGWLPYLAGEWMDLVMGFASRRRIERVRANIQTLLIVPQLGYNYFFQFPDLSGRNGQD